MSKMEFRFKPVDLDFTERNDKMVVSGYVNLTGEFSNVLSTGHSGHEFIEKIESGAFARALTRNEEIDFLAEHDSSLILSSTRNNSLSLVEDDKGLYMSAIITPTSWGQDYYTLVKDGILKNFSFGFIALEDEWAERNDGILERTIKELDLFEVSVVRHPAYPQSQIQARNLDVITELDLEEKAKEVRKMKKEEKKEVEVREDQVDDQAEDIDEEDQLVTLEKTVLALDLKIDKLYNMVKEALTELLRDEKDEEEDEEPAEKEDEVEEDDTDKDDLEDEEEDELEDRDANKDDKKDEKRSNNDENTEILNDVIADLKSRVQNLK